MRHLTQAHAAQTEVAVDRARTPALLAARDLPFAPIRRPEELFDDPHLLATGGLADITLPDGARAGQSAPTALLPFTMAGQRMGVRRDPPRLGQHTDAVLTMLGCDAARITQLREERVVL